MLLVNDFELVTAIERPEIVEMSHDIAVRVWPEFMLNDPISDKYWNRMNELHPRFQFMLLEKKTGELAAFGNSIPVQFSGDLKDLPDKGWDWALESGCENKKANYLSAIQIMVPLERQSKGVSYIALKVMQQLGQESGFSSLIAPVRPSKKHLYPLVPMEDYIGWKDKNGECFDPWLRAHARLGATIIKVCPESMRIPGTVEQWESWTGLKFLQSGSYVIPGALNVVEVDLESNESVYIEPNVWMIHR